MPAKSNLFTEKFSRFFYVLKGRFLERYMHGDVGKRRGIRL